MTSYPDVITFVFEFWSLGFFFAIAMFYAAKFYFSPKGLWRSWSGPE